MVTVAFVISLPPGNELNNREWATLVWLAIGVTWVLSRKDMRPLVANVVRTAIHPLLLIPAVVLWGWTALVVLAAFRLHLWTGDLFKDTVIWLIGPALGLYFSVTKLSKDPLFFRRMARDTVRYTVLIEFYVNLRVFSLPVELLLLPTITFLALLAVVAGTDKKYRPVKTLLDYLMFFAGMALLVFVTVTLVNSLHGEDFGHDARDLALPVWLTIGALPYLHALSLFTGYQSAFVRVDWWMKGDKKAARRAKLALVLELNARTHLVHQFGGRWLTELAEARTSADAHEVVRRYRIAGDAKKPQGS